MQPKSNPAEILYSTKSVRDRIMYVLQEPGLSDRRVVLVAFLGADALSYLPHPGNLLVVCSPTPGATSPAAIRELLIRKAQVKFSHGLHMKVYWSSSRGCVVTSANASTSAFGARGLKEAGVFLGPGVVEINRLIEEASPQPITEAAMATLERENKRLPRRFMLDQRHSNIDYLTWYQSPFRAPWKLGWYDTDGDFAEAAISKARQEFDADPNDMLPFRKKQISQADYLLAFLVKDRAVHRPYWFYAQFVTPVSKRDPAFHPGYPSQAVQVQSSSKCPRPPFAITPGFRKAFASAVHECGLTAIQAAESLIPPDKLLDVIAARMSGVGRQQHNQHPLRGRR
jgi:hypothetical protein